MTGAWQITSSKDFLPRLRTFIISSSDLLIKSSTVLMPARLRQLKAAYRQVKFFNGHLKDLFFSVIVLLHHDFGVIGLVGKINKQVEMFVEDLGA